MTHNDSKINEIEKKIHDHDRGENILLLENETADNFIARLKQANLGSKNGIAFVKNRF